MVVKRGSEWCVIHAHDMKEDSKTDKPKSSKEHPTMKPVELYENAILNSSESGMIMYEPFSGSGTAFIAAQNTGRICYGIEISPSYCSVILERMKTAFPDIKIEKING